MNDLSTLQAIISAEPITEKLTEQELLTKWYALATTDDSEPIETVQAIKAQLESGYRSWVPLFTLFALKNAPETYLQLAAETIENGETPCNFDGLDANDLIGSYKTLCLELLSISDEEDDPFGFSDGYPLCQTIISQHPRYQIEVDARLSGASDCGTAEDLESDTAAARRIVADAGIVI